MTKHEPPPGIGHQYPSDMVAIPRVQHEALMGLRVAARCLTARASGVTITDVAGNSFRSVFADDLAALDAALRAAGIDREDGM